MTFKQLKQYRGSLSLGLMIIITGITQVLTLMKSSLVAGIFGTGVEIDAYNLANSIVSFLFGFIAAGISTVIIPNYVRKTDRRNVDSFITVLYGLIALIVGTIWTAFGYFLAWWFVLESAAVAASKIQYSLITSAAGIVVAIILTPKLQKVVRRLFTKN